MILLFFIIALAALGIGAFMQGPRFGKLPSGERLERIKRSPHFRDGQFQNTSFTPTLAEGASMLTVMRKFFFGKGKHSKPPFPLPSTKTDLLHVDRSKNCLVWFGHSSYFIQVDGRKNTG